MREILFRGKDKDDGNWYEGYYLQLHDTMYCCLPSDNVEEANRLNKENEHHYIVFEQMTDWELPNKHLKADVLPETVCQYTGLTDKNGRKIFEGDIVLFTDNIKIKGTTSHTSNVEWNTKIGGFVFHAECIGYYNVNPLQIERYEVEVIGNIFDNPELLKGDKE